VVHACAAHATADSRSTRRETGIMAQQAASSSQPGAAAAAAAARARRGAAGARITRSIVAARGLGYEAAGGLALQNSPADSDRSQPAVSSHAESWFRTSYSRGRNPK
jgi:hypothetical protein